MIIHKILYVKDQGAAMKFYSATLGRVPTLHVSGITEFCLNEGAVLGLMPEKGINRLLTGCEWVRWKQK